MGRGFWRWCFQTLALDTLSGLADRDVFPLLHVQCAVRTHNPPLSSLYLSLCKNPTRRDKLHFLSFLAHFPLHLSTASALLPSNQIPHVTSEGHNCKFRCTKMLFSSRWLVVVGESSWCWLERRKAHWTWKLGTCSQKPEGQEKTWHSLQNRLFLFPLGLYFFALQVLLKSYSMHVLVSYARECWDP